MNALKMTLVCLFVLPACKCEKEEVKSPPSSFLTDATLEITPEMQESWEIVRQGILTHDIDAMTMTMHFPVKSIDYIQTAIDSSKTLERQFSSIFTPRLISLIENNHTTLSKSEKGFEVDFANGYMILGFENIEGSYRLTYLGSLND